MAHLAIVVRRPDAEWVTLLASQSSIALASLVAVGAYVVVETAPDWHANSVLLSFVTNSLMSPETYLHALGYFFFFASALLVLGLLFRGTGLVETWDADLITRFLYAASAVLLACDYVWRRPLFSSLADPGETGFFFAVGLFGLETSLPTFLLATAIAIYRWRHQTTG